MNARRITLQLSHDERSVLWVSLDAWEARYRSSRIAAKLTGTAGEVADCEERISAIYNLKRRVMRAGLKVARRVPA